MIPSVVGDFDWIHYMELKDTTTPTSSLKISGESITWSWKLRRCKLLLLRWFRNPLHGVESPAEGTPTAGYTRRNPLHGVESNVYLAALSACLYENPLHGVESCGGLTVGLNPTRENAQNPLHGVERGRPSPGGTRWWWSEWIHYMELKGSINMIEAYLPEQWGIHYMELKVQNVW